MAGVWGMRRTIEEGLPPLWRMEFLIGDASVMGCRCVILTMRVRGRASKLDPVACHFSNVEFLRWADGLGYDVYDFNLKRRLTLSDWETLGVLRLRGATPQISHRHGLQPAALLAVLPGLMTSAGVNDLWKTHHIPMMKEVRYRYLCLCK